MSLWKNSEKLAEKIWEFENADKETEREWIKNGRKPVKLGDNVSMELSEDHLCWYIMACPDEYYNSQDFIKIVPRFGISTKEQLVKILKAQSWVHI